MKVEEVGLDCAPEVYNELIEKLIIKNEISKSVKLDHPTEPEMNFLYGTIFTGLPKKCKQHSRNVCIFANGEVDKAQQGLGVKYPRRLQSTLSRRLILEIPLP